MRRAALSSLIVLAAVTATAPPAHSEADPPSTSSRGDHRPPSPGCGTAPPVEPGTTASRTIDSGGREREYLVHVPENYRPDRPTSVVLSFHGHGHTAAYQEKLSGFSGVNAISVYPQGLVGTDGKTAWQGAPYSTGDDVQFTDDVLDDVQGGLCVDPARIYASGKSNGGGFTETLACRRGDRIAAFAPVSGARYPQGGECAPAEPVPMVFFHGKADNKIPYDGDPSRGLPAIPDWLRAWSGHDRCRPEPITIRPQPAVTRQNWIGCDDRGALAHYGIDGLGHAWPSRSPNGDSEKPTAIDATPIIWKFFQQHPLTS